MLQLPDHHEFGVAPAFFHTPDWQREDGLAKLVPGVKPALSGLCHVRCPRRNDDVWLEHLRVVEAPSVVVRHEQSIHIDQQHTIRLRPACYGLGRHHDGFVSGIGVCGT